jgi:hypothetical protein
VARRAGGGERFTPSPFAYTAGGSEAIQYARKILLDLSIRNPHDPQTEASKDFVTLRVISRLTIVNPTVHFDDETGSMAVEIGDESADDLLAPEMQPIQTTSTKMFPEDPFSLRHITAEFSGPLHLNPINLLPDYDVVWSRHASFSLFYPRPGFPISCARAR